MTDHLSRIHNISKGLEVVEPFAYAELLAKENIISADKIAETAAVVLTTPTSMFLYDGVRLMIQKIVHSGSDVVLWTQGDPQMQQAKCDTSGLLQLAEDTHGHISVAPAIDKITLLDGLLTPKHTEGKNHLIIIDDKSTQLFRSCQELMRIREVEHRILPKDTMYIWLRKDRKNRDIFPEGFPTLPELTAFIDGDFKALEKIDELPILANSLYLIDFDRTLFKTDDWFSTVQERIVTEICPHPTAG